MPKTVIAVGRITKVQPSGYRIATVQHAERGVAAGLLGTRRIK